MMFATGVFAQETPSPPLSVEHCVKNEGYASHFVRTEQVSLIQTHSCNKIHAEDGSFIQD